MSKSPVETALEAIASAHLALAEAIKTEFPVGTNVYWCRGGHRQYGVVCAIVPHKVFVENIHTGRRYGLGPEYLTAVHGGGVVA